MTNAEMVALLEKIAPKTSSDGQVLIGQLISELQKPEPAPEPTPEPAAATQQPKKRKSKKHA